MKSALMFAVAALLLLGVLAVAGCDDSGAAPTDPVGTSADIGTVEGALAAVCKANDDCGDEMYCRRAAGQCTSRGHCSNKPAACPDIYAPVCGCDGETYGNHCDAAAMGASVAYQGECKAKVCRVDGHCADGQFCKKGSCDPQAKGVCSDMPEICIEIYAPVCGCDGETYGNWCFADAAGVNLAHDGECALACGGIAGFPCPDGMFCEFEEGTCAIFDNMGVCVDVPWGCPDVWDPVCGCDGVTYGNDCERQTAGVSKAHDGACEVVAGCKVNEECGPKEYCAKDGCDGPGACEWKPEACFDLWDPVCGCDGKTYSNTCYAAAAGVNVAHAGECALACGGIAGFPCPDGMFCEFEEGTCAIFDNMGVCVDVPWGCPDVWDPVCGCDGVTYGNDCERQTAGVSKAHDGACEVVAGCKVNEECGPKEYCAKDGCDGPGACAWMPEACILLYDPVCGCDGVTYSNACFAASAGVNVAHAGECEVVVGCKYNGECAAGEYCAKDDCDGLGTCEWKPEACFDLWDPVCGCDGKTYSNTCYAAAAGVNVAHAGECSLACGGIAGFPCPAGMFCELEEGTCDIVDNMGTCVATPEICPPLWDPVCGCDGKTYANDCTRQSAGASKAHHGECEVVAACKANEECAPSEYCAKDGCDGLGTCEWKPEGCAAYYDPMCGCDGKTYSNACMAAAAGVNVSYAGACTMYCGGLAGLSCPTGMFCEFEPGTCPIFDNMGVCVEVPGACPDVWDPVCGCDGKTYSNDCDRQAAGVSKDHDGTCEVLYDCTSDAQCATGWYCFMDAGLCAGGGSCQKTPDGCGGVYDPVCGCDGVTYSSSCMAAAAGANVAYPGLCKGCTDNSQCAGADYCAKDYGDCGGVGSCEAKPELCPAIYDPVCGCDGMSYSNACAAASAGVNVSDGPCFFP